MLGSNTWSEGQGRRIETEDSPAALDNFLSLVYTRRIETEDSLAALDNFVSLVYTGSLADSQLERQGRDAVVALIETGEMSHRYQVESFDEVITVRLRGQVTLESFPDICAFALRHRDLKERAAPSSTQRKMDQTRVLGNHGSDRYLHTSENL